MSTDVLEGSRLFNALDRCDRCGAAAMYASVLKDCEGKLSELLWCGHHYTEHADALYEKDWAIINNENLMDTA